jgi:transposase InsO family protein
VPWKTRTPVDLRREFIRRLHAGERLTELCREYGISRKTGHKFRARFERFGLDGLDDRSRAPLYIPHKTFPEVERMVIAERSRRPSWGPKKLKVSLERRHGREFPAASTIGDILLRAGLVNRRVTRFRRVAQPTSLRVATSPNDVWCIDYKGQFRLGSGPYCYPLTVTDQFSRYLFAVDAMSAVDGEAAKEVCQDLFREYGLPQAIRSDNGAPFASVGLHGISSLSAYWMLLGIELERIRPAHPEENGRHERMHRTLKEETAKPPSTNLLQQQERFDAFRADFNATRPHEALAMKAPADVYKKSKRRFPTTIPDPDYAGYDDVVRVNCNGTIRINRNHVYLGMAFRQMPIGIDEQKDGRWLVTFVSTDLGYADLKTNRLIPINP